MILYTGWGRYGNLGPFECPYCATEYYATIDDNPEEKVYIDYRGEQPYSLLSGHDSPLAVLHKIERTE